MHIRDDSFFNVFIDKLDLSLIQLVLLGKKHYVLEDSFRTEDLGLFIGHVIIGKRVEGR